MHNNNIIITHVNILLVPYCWRAVAQTIENLAILVSDTDINHVLDDVFAH